MDVTERRRWIMPLLLSFIAITRLCVIFLFPRPFAGDMIVYENLALSLLGGHGFTHGLGLPPTATQMPLYPLLISAVYSIFGQSHTALYLVQTGIDVTTGFIVYLTAKLLFESRRLAYVAVLLWAIYLPAAELAGSALTETLCTLLVALSIYATMVFVRKARVGILLVAGIFLGLATLTRPFVFGFPLFLILPLLFFLPQRRLTFIGALICLAGMVAVLSPWAIRNYECFHAFVPLSSDGARNLYKSIFHIAEEDYAKPGRDSDFPSDVQAFLDSTPSEVKRDRFLFQRSLELIRAHPWRYVKLSFHKFPRLWFNVGMGGPPSFKSLLFMAGNLLLMAFALFAVFSRRLLRNALSWPPISFLLYITIFHVASNAFGRYSIPAVPALIVLASPGLSDGGEFLEARLNLFRRNTRTSN